MIGRRDPYADIISKLSLYMLCMCTWQKSAEIVNK